MFSTGIQQKCTSTILILCACFLQRGSTQVGAPAPTTVPLSTVGIDNFILMSRREFAATIAGLDLTMANFRENYGARVETINAQALLLEKRINEVTANLNPLDVLSPLSRVCVQRYRGNIATLDSIKTSLSACALAATNSLPTFLANALTTRNQLSTYHSASVDQLLAACARTYADRTWANYTGCVETAMATVRTTTVTNQRTFDTQVQVAQCSADARIRDSIDCGYTVQYTTISGIAENMRLINNCIAGLDSCPVCPTLTTCPYSVQMNSTDAAVTREYIINPFRNLITNATCVELRIIRT